MSNSDILRKVFELKDMLVDSELYKRVKLAEEKMMKDETCFILLNTYQDVQKEYNEAKRFEKYGSDVLSVQKQLSDIKKKVNENELVIKYNEVYKEMKKELKKIEKMLFKDIIEERKEMLAE